MTRNVIRIALGAIVLLALSLTSAAFANGWQQVKKAGVLKVGIEGTYAPFDFMSEDNKPTGFDVDVMRQIGKDLGVKIKFVETQWTALIGGVNAGKFDAIAADMSVTPKRAKSVDFTLPYNATGAVLICRKDNAKYHALSDLKGARVGAGAGTTFATLAQSAPGAKVVLYNSFPAYLQDLMNQRLDVIINAKSVSSYVIREHNYPLKICSDILNKDNLGLIAVALKKGNKTLLHKINASIKKLVKSPQYKDMYKKWFGTSNPPLLQHQSQNASS